MIFSSFGSIFEVKMVLDLFLLLYLQIEQGSIKNLHEIREPLPFLFTKYIKIKVGYL